ncbi:MAG: hypothetical protein ACOCV2_00315 [Persicimonas sp.]
MDRRSTDTLASWWRWALGCFVLAAATGVVFRVGLAAGGLPVDLTFANVRRAHSHLMFFSWVSPALMALIALYVVRRTGVAPGRPIALILVANLVLGLASFMPFLLDGYGTTAVFDVEMPLSIIFSTSAMFGWYAFAVWYWRRRRHLEATTAIALWDVSVAALVVSSLGAWARGALMGLGVEDPLWTDGSIHLFLGYFSDGWLALGALAIVHEHLGVEMRGRRRVWTGLMVAGLPLTFVLGMPRDIVPDGVWSLATLAGLFVGLGLLGHLAVLWRNRRGGFWTFALVALGAKALANVAFVVPAVAAWAQDAGLRLMYLHVLFLGCVTVVLVEAARHRWGNVGAAQSRWMQAAVAVLLVTMVPTTGLWPSGSGRALLWVAAAGSFAPVCVAIWIFVTARNDDADVGQDFSEDGRPRLDDRAGASPPGVSPHRTGGR